jgi:hypothetical protein
MGVATPAGTTAGAADTPAIVCPATDAGIERTNAIPTPHNPDLRMMTPIAHFNRQQRATHHQTPSLLIDKCFAQLTKRSTTNIRELPVRGLHVI